MLCSQHRDCCPAPAHGHLADVFVRVDSPQLAAGQDDVLPAADVTRPAQLRHHALPSRHQL